MLQEIQDYLSKEKWDRFVVQLVGFFFASPSERRSPYLLWKGEESLS
jgi:hypothetical protein